MINIGLLGLGNVGAGVIEILKNNSQWITQRTGKKISIKTAVVRDISKKRNVDLGSIRITDNADDVLCDPEIDVVVEVMGGEKPAYDYICKALNNKKFVVTANKEVVAKHKMTFFELAKKNKTDIYFEASVGGGIPLIRTLKVGFAANRIKSLYGILNGTTNYILTKIEEEKTDFKSVLKKAQDLGFAEADPSMDITGLDAAYKLVILAAIAFKADVTLSDVQYEGIEDVSLKDITIAKELGYTIKLLAIGKDDTEKIALKVHPTMIPLNHPLAGVRNEFNALFIDGDAVGEAMLLGKGAGPLPTGSSVVSDIIDLSFDIGSKITKRNLEDNITKRTLMAVEDTQSQFYLRLLAPDTYGVLEKITGIFGRNKVSISKIIQKDMINSDAEIVIVTHTAKEKNVNQAVKELKKNAAVKELYTVIRVGLEE